MDLNECYNTHEESTPEDKEFSFRGYWGSELLRPFVEHSKKGVHYCIYCGSIADTREHVPSKVFLDKSITTDNLPTLPACYKCNNGFSSDELYTNAYIECVKSFIGDNNYTALELNPTDRKEVIEAKNAVKQACENGTFPIDGRIERILCKLAIGHIAYELFELINSDSFSVENVSIGYVFKCSVNKGIWDSLETIELIENDVFPEVGSRAFRNMCVLNISNGNADNSLTNHHLFMDWTYIQDGVYRYIALYDEDSIVVKMIIRDYLYAEVVFRKNQ